MLVFTVIRTNRSQADEEEVQFARDLRERVLQEFPELKTFNMRMEPIGPHPTGMFEVDISTPAQFGAFVPWLAMHRGSLSVLVHSNTGNNLRDHSQNAIWIGEKLPLKLSIFDKPSDMEKVNMKLKQLRDAQGFQNGT